MPAPSITAYRNKCEFTIGYSKSKDQFRKEKKLREEVLEKQKLNERVLRDEFSLDNFRRFLNEEQQHYNHLINPQGLLNLKY